MQINRIYFSPTGSTEKVVKLLTSLWTDEAEDIDISFRDQNYGAYDFSNNGLCVIGVPSYGGRVPAIALAHLEQMKAADTPTVLVVTFGNRAYDDTLLELKNSLKARGFRVVAALAAVTEHSLMHQFGTGRPDAKDQEALLAFGGQIKEALTQNTQLPEVQVDGNLPYREYKGVPLKPSTNKDCTRCGVCAKACPTGAIPLAHPNQTQNGDCISCMRCLAICPEQARLLNKAIFFVASKKMEKSCLSRKENSFFFDKV